MISKKGVKQDDKHTGEKIAALRKQQSLKQEDLARMLNISPQAVSKWENDVSCPDISILPHLAKILSVSIDELLSDSPEKIPPVCFNGTDKKKDPKNMVLRIAIDCQDGDKIRVNLPIPLIQMIIELGLSVPELSGNDVLKNINFTQIIELVECGVTGNLLEIDDADGDIIRIFVE